MSTSEQQTDEYEEFMSFDDLEFEISALDNNDDAMMSPTAAGSVPTSTASEPTRNMSTSRPTAQPRRRINKRIARPQSEFSLDKAKEQGAELLLFAVKSVANNPFVADPALEHAPPVKAFADKCLVKAQTLTHDLLVKFGLVLLTLWPAISIADKHTTSSQRQFAMFQKFHSLWTDMSLVTQIKTFLMQLADCNYVPPLYPSMLLRILFKRMVILHEEVHVQASGPELAHNVLLTAVEENALRYTGGYIVSRLRRKIKFGDHDEIDSALKKMTEGNDKDTRLNYTKEWVTVQSRGGLVVINDVTFLFFAQLEKIVRQFLPKLLSELRGTDIRKAIYDNAVTNRKLIDLWDQIIGHTLGESDSLKLMQLVIKFYGQVRGFSYARNIVEKYKIRVKSIHSGQRSLRAGLKRTSNSTSTS